MYKSRSLLTKEKDLFHYQLANHTIVFKFYLEERKMKVTELQVILDDLFNQSVKDTSEKNSKHKAESKSLSKQTVTIHSKDAVIATPTIRVEEKNNRTQG